MNTFNRDRGSVLIAVLVMAIIVSGFCVVSLLVSGTESRGANRAILRDRALFVAQSGLEDQFKTFNDMKQQASLLSPFFAFDALKGTTPIQRRPLVSDGLTIGEYTVAIDCVTAVDTWNRDMTVTATGWVPSASDPQAVSRTVTAIIRLGLSRSEVFDYVYFVNNWGWYYGSTIVANGNVRANGQFDFGGYDPIINGLPRFDAFSSSGTFGEQLDDGGVYAGWNIVNAARVRGSTVGASHMHPFDQRIPMPNLTDLTAYETMAKAKNSGVKIDGAAVCGSVVGENPGDKTNLYLDGTNPLKPIELNGPVVVRGDLIIKGYVKGKGSFYVKGNIYVAGNVTYVNPIEATPVTKDKAVMEGWVARNQSADALGLFARKHVIVGDYTNGSWQAYVSQWVYDWRNDSNEDAGEDGIPNTRSGKDGIRGTADDDVLEGDGKWTVERYEAGDALPEGAKVGDAIPGTGEDIDGDGQYSPPTRMADFNITSTLTRPYWAGNFPDCATAKTYSALCTNGLKVTRLDAAFYTNHSFAMLTLDSTKDLVVNGCLVARNEDIVYGTKRAVFNYDLRLLQDENPQGLDLPRTWKPMKMVMWQSN